MKELEQGHKAENKKARASYMNPKRKKKKKNIQIRQHNKTKLKQSPWPTFLPSIV